MTSSQAQQSLALRPHQNLWQRALQSLSADDRALVDFDRLDRLAVLERTLALAEEKKKQCLLQRWKIKRSHGRNLVLRDVFGKIIVWVHKFKEIGDIVVQYDPAHAALPWAGVRLLLEITISDNQMFGAMIEGLEVITNLLPRYAIIEDIYLRGPSLAAASLENSLVMLYSASLMFLAKNIHYFSKSTVKRVLTSISSLTDNSLNSMLRNIHALQHNVNQDTKLIDGERQHAILSGVDRLSSIPSGWYSTNGHVPLPQDSTSSNEDLEQRTEYLIRLHNALGQPLGRMANQLVRISDNLNHEQRLSIFRWLSTIPYAQHHENMRQGRLSSTGLWLLNHVDYLKSTSSSYSSILWIHGAPGSGKTKLMSVIIDEMLKCEEEGAAPVAYFYCSRDSAEPERANPERIISSIARQLSGTNVTKPLREAATHKYEYFVKASVDIRSFSLHEASQLILEILAETPAVIVIDALDECNPLRRHEELLDCLDDIIQKSVNVVKAIVSSRDDGDILCRLEKSPNVYISANESAEDIHRFVNHEVSLAIGSRRLLGGKVSDQLRHRIITALEDGAEGMFRWVSLQLQNLCDPRRIKVEQDLLEELGRLPKSLSHLYDRIYEEILHSADYSRSVGIKILKWLRGAQRTLKVPEILGAVSLRDGSNATQMTVRDILNMTCNLVVEDTILGCLRYAHVSVREYLDTRPDFSDDNTHRLLTERCLEAYLLHYPKDPLLDYSMYHWLEHYAKLSPPVRSALLDSPLLPFFFQGANASRFFRQWRDDVDRTIHLASSHFFNIDKEYNLKSNLRAATTPFLTMCIFGLHEVLEVYAAKQPSALATQLFESSQVPGRLYPGCTGLHIGILNRHFSLVDFLLLNGCQTSLCTARGETPLYLAVCRHSMTMVGLLLRQGADPDARSYIQGNPNERSTERFTDAPRSGVRSSLGFRGSSGRVMSVLEEDAEAPIHLAARNGDTRCLSELLSHGAGVNKKTAIGFTALHLGLLGGKTNVVEILLTAGADVNISLTHGRTPLHLAAAAGNSRAVALLMEGGANPQQRDGSGNCAKDVAHRYGHLKLAESLRRFSSDNQLSRPDGSQTPVSLGLLERPLNASSRRSA